MKKSTVQVHRHPLYNNEARDHHRVISNTGTPNDVVQRPVGEFHSCVLCTLHVVDTGPWHGWIYSRMDNLSGGEKAVVVHVKNKSMKRVRKRESH